MKLSDCNVALNIGYFAGNTQQAIDAGLNGFAVQLLAESYGDKIEQFPDGAIGFASEDHKRRSIYVIVSPDPPVPMDPVQGRDPIDVDDEFAQVMVQIAHEVGRQIATSKHEGWTLDIEKTYDLIRDRMSRAHRSDHTERRMLLVTAAALCVGAIHSHDAKTKQIKTVDTAPSQVPAKRFRCSDCGGEGCDLCEQRGYFDKEAA